MRAALAQQEQQQLRIEAGVGGDQLARRDHRPFLAQQRAFERAIIEPRDRRFPRRGKPFRARLLAQLVKRLHRRADRPRDLGDDADGGEGGYQPRRDRIAARARVDVGGEAEQRIVGMVARPRRRLGWSGVPLRREVTGSGGCVGQLVKSVADDSGLPSRIATIVRGNAY